MPDTVLYPTLPKRPERPGCDWLSVVVVVANVADDPNAVSAIAAAKTGNLITNPNKRPAHLTQG